VAAAALMIDYILTAAVGITAGIGAVVSDQPWLQPHTLLLCLMVLAFLALVNMRGVKDTGAAFIGPTFLFVGTVLTTVAFGFFRVIAAGGHPVARAAMPHPLPATMVGLGVWLALKSFSNGCAAMTGVEAVSNGVMAFREPRVKNAQMALTVIMGTLVIMLFGTAWLAKKYGIMAMDPALPGYQSLLSLIVHGRLRTELVLSLHHVDHLPGPDSERQHRLRRLPARHPRRCHERLPAACLHPARAAPAVLGRNLRPHRADGNHPDQVQRQHRPHHLAVRHRRLPGIHALAGRHGDALEETGWPNTRDATGTCSSTAPVRSRPASRPSSC
jgi:hypothetical protein